MKRLCLRLLVSFLTFFIGMSTARISFDKAPSPIPTQETRSVTVSVVGTLPITDKHPSLGKLLINKMCISNDSLKYKGVKVTRSYNADIDKSKVTITKGCRVLAIHSDGQGLEAKETSCFGLYPVLGGETKQLVIVQTSGGAHCCFSYWIYDLYPKFRGIFDSTEYPIGDGFDELSFLDIDRDGVMEFTQRVMTFDYWEDMAYTSAPQPTVVFKYDPQANRFYPANRKFEAYLLKGIEKEIKELDRDDILSQWINGFDITLRYIYAGQEKKAWQFYDREFDVKPHEVDEMKSKIKIALRNDAAYRFIHK